jgi:hypothetical protein
MSKKSKSAPSIHLSVLTLQRFAASFYGLTIEEARKRLARGKFEMTTWGDSKFGGKQLVAAFPKYEVRLLFLSDNRVGMASVQVLSKWAR